MSVKSNLLGIELPFSNRVVQSRLAVSAKEKSCARLICYTPADLAQLVEHLICNQRVSGSNPLIGMGIQSRIMHNVASRDVPRVPFSACFLLW